MARFLSLILLVASSGPLFAQPARLQERLREAIEYDDVPLVHQLLAEGADVNQETKGKPSLLEEAAYARNPAIMQALLERSPQRRLLNRALLAAAIAGCGPAIKEVTVLPDAAAKPPAEPLDSAPARITEMLLRAGAEPNYRDSQEEVALDIAAAGGAVRIIEVLLRYGADINLADKEGNTALISAACECSVATPPDATKAVKFLLDRGADPNLRDSEGDTALMIAAEHGNFIAAKLLLDHGANAQVKNKKGQTALSLAKKESNKTIVELLESYKK